MGSGCNGCLKAYTHASAPLKGKRFTSNNMSYEEFEAKIGKRGYELGDENFSGNISKKEWAALFKKLDSNNDDVVDREEWEHAFGKGSFDVWDTNDDATVNYKEWCHIYLSKTGKDGLNTYFDNLPSQKARRTSRKEEEKAVKSSRITTGVVGYS